MSNDTCAISRAEFIAKFVSAGFGYSEARRAYYTMVSTFEDAILTGSRVSIGRVGALVPTKRPPRVIKMGFSRTKSGVKKVSREFSYSETVKWKFRIYRTFAKRHSVDGRIV